MAFLLSNHHFGEKLIIENGQTRIARSQYRITLPVSYTPDLAYLTGYHLGDGYLYSHKSNRDKPAYEILYSDEHKCQIDSVIAPIFRKYFGVELHVHKRQNNVWIGRINCKVLHMFFNQILGLPAGRKEDFSIPEWVLLDNVFLKEFISGFFDAEGSIFISKPDRVSITLTNSNYQILQKIQNLLWTCFGIAFGKIYKKQNIDVFEMKTSAKEVILRFCDKIGFRHPHKIEKMKEGIALLEQKYARPSKVARPPAFPYEAFY
jgi:hypothetical protein